MTINFSRFAQKETVILPIYRGIGSYKHRKLKFDRKVNGWYVVITGTDPMIVRPVSLAEKRKALFKHKQIRGYSFGEEIVPLNFQSLLNLGYGETVKVRLQKAPIWEIIKAAKWEDGNLYYNGIDREAERESLKKVKSRFEAEENIDGITGLTPELKYYFIVLSLRRHSLLKIDQLESMRLTNKERNQRLKEFRNGFKERLKKTIESAGGKLVRLSKLKSGRHKVIWRIGVKNIITKIDDNLMIKTNDGGKSLSSAILLARLFRDDPKSIYYNI